MQYASNINVEGRLNEGTEVGVGTTSRLPVIKVFGTS
jgi:hypothetical protein